MTTCRDFLKRGGMVCCSYCRFAPRLISPDTPVVVLLGECHSLNHVIHNEHCGEHLPAGQVADEKEKEALGDALEVAGEEDHVDEGESFHGPKTKDIEDGRVPASGVDMVEALICDDLDVLHEHLGESHEAEKERCVHVLILVVPIPLVMRVHPHEGEAAMDGGGGFNVDVMGYYYKDSRLVSIHFISP